MPLSLSRSLSDNAAASDSLSRVRNFGRTLAENARASDAIKTLYSYSLSDGAAASDSLAMFSGRIPLSGTITAAFMPTGSITLFTLPTSVIPPHRAPYLRIVIVDKTGRPYADLPNARITRPPTRILNGIGSCEFEFPTLDPNQAQVQLLNREVQVWRNGTLWWWGVMVDAEADFETVRISCFSLEWYLYRLFFGPITLHFLQNRNFDDPVPLNYWTRTTATATKQSAADGAPTILGPNVAKLTTPNAYTDAYISQRSTVYAGAGLSITYFPKAWYFLVGSNYQGPALNERGLFAILYDEHGVEQQRSAHGGLISNSHTRDGWARLELTQGLVVPAGRTNWILETRLYAPGGTIYWGATDVTVEESVATSITGSDINSLIQLVIAYAQDPTRLKSDLALLYSGAATGKILQRAYQFFDNANLWESLQEWCVSDVADFSISYDANGRTRTFNTHPGKKGSVKPAWPISSGRNILGGHLSVRGSDTATSSRILSSQPTGPNRETGVAIDTSQTNGLILESVDSVPKEVPIDGLQAIATSHVTRFRAPARTPSYEIAAEGFIENVDVGDTVPVYLNHGWLQENDLRRVVSLAWDPDEDKLTVEVNDR